MSTNKQVQHCHLVYKSISTHANHEVQTLYNECKDNLLLSSNSDKKPIDSLFNRNEFGIDKGIDDLGVYLSNSIMDDMHTFSPLTPASAREIGLYRQSHPASMYNQRISGLRMFFDDDREIDHIWLTKIYDRDYIASNPGMRIDYASITKMNSLGIDKPDNYRIKGRNVLQFASKKGHKAVIFGVEQGNNGLWHMHVASQGFLKEHKYVLNRTGWGYIKAEGDRNECFNIDEDNPHRITGFYPTLKYCMQKIYPNSKAYLKMEHF